VPVDSGVTFMLPARFCGPLHAPLAVHAVTPLETHVSSALCPSVMVVGATLIDTVGLGGDGGGTIGSEPTVP